MKEWRLRLGAGGRAGIDEDDRQVGRRGAGHHVARVLLVPGRVGDDEVALRGREVAVGHVDRDALLALGLEAVREEGEIDLRTGPDARAVGLAGSTADPRRSICVSWRRRPMSVDLPSSTLPHGGEAQEILRRVPLDEPGKRSAVGRVVMLRSSPRASSSPSSRRQSWSMTRVPRSEVRAIIISSRISLTRRRRRTHGARSTERSRGCGTGTRTFSICSPGLGP